MLILDDVSSERHTDKFVVFHYFFSHRSFKRVSGSVECKAPFLQDLLSCFLGGGGGGWWRHLGQRVVQTDHFYMFPDYAG